MAETGAAAAERQIETEVCIVGGGPAGVMLGYLLARAGIDVVVLEKHADFFRDFRGDTIHPSTVALLGQLGLRDEFLALPHSEVRTLDTVVNGIRVHAIDFGVLPAPNDFLAFMPQWDFLNFLATKARELPTFRLLMGTEATGILGGGTDAATPASGDPGDAGGAGRAGGPSSAGGAGGAGRSAPITGVSATDAEGGIRILAPLTVAADGRWSIVRAAAGLTPREFGVPIDVLWFSLPKPASPPPPTLAYLDRGSFVLTIDRRDHYQAGCIIPKGSFEAVKARGLEAFRSELVATAKPLRTVVHALDDWDQVKLLTVQIARLETWHRPGLLCIGDSAHAMSPAFGVGVNYAIQDAVATANRLVGPLRRGTVTEADLAAVQRRRLLPVRAMQAVQLRLHRTIATTGAAPLLSNPPTPVQRAVLRIVVPLLRWAAPRLIGRGFRPETIDDAVLRP